MIEDYLGVSPSLGENVWIHSSAIVIGQVVLGDDVSIWPCAVLRGDVNVLTLGNRSNVQDGAVIHATHVSAYNDKGYATTVGDDVTIGHNAVLHGCTIGNRVLIGMAATILDGATVPDDVIVGANSLVPMHKKLESGWLYVGSPVKALRELTEKEKKFLPYSAQNYMKLKSNYK